MIDNSASISVYAGFGEVMAPGDPSDPVPSVDGRDLGAWMIRLAESGVTGVFNVTGPSSAMTIGEGLAFRPLAETARDTLAWFQTLPEERRSRTRAGLPAEREADVLAAWHPREGSPRR